MPPLKEGLARTLAAGVREYVELAEKRIIEILEKRIERIPHGPKGDKGEPGESVVGAPGKDGIDGKNGRDAIDGKDGKDGRSIIGPSGKDGESVSVESVRLMVLDEVRKEIALIPKAKDGKDGRDGLHGVSAFDLEILSGIDAARTYQRGTIATSNGGILRFKEDSWEVIVDGIASVRCEDTEDPRELKIVIERTSGKETILTRHIPMMIYRGIFTDEVDYMRGDTVSRDGSTWHCNVNGTKQIPGNANSQDWTLCNKRGSPGKDADKQTPTNGNHPVRLK